MAKAELARAFCLWPDDAGDRIRNKQDEQFLKSMMTDRVATFGSFDAVLDKKVKRKEAREEGMRKFREKESTHMNKVRATVSMPADSETDGDETATEVQQDSRQPKRRKLGQWHTCMFHQIFFSLSDLCL